MTTFPIRVTHTGLRLLALTAVQTATTLPYDDSGNFPRYIRVAVEPNVNNTAGVSSIARIAFGQMGDATLTNAVTDLMLSQYDGGVIIESRGLTVIKVISGAQTAYVNVTPLEDGRMQQVNVS